MAHSVEIATGARPARPYFSAIAQPRRVCAGQREAGAHPRRWSGVGESITLRWTRRARHVRVAVRYGRETRPGISRDLQCMCYCKACGETVLFRVRRAAPDLFCTKAGVLCFVGRASCGFAARGPLRAAWSSVCLSLSAIETGFVAWPRPSSRTCRTRRTASLLPMRTRRRPGCLSRRKLGPREARAAQKTCSSPLYSAQHTIWPPKMQRSGARGGAVN